MTADDIRDVTSQLLYAKQFWGVLAVALAQAASGDGSLMRAIVNLIAPSDDPSLDRFFAISAGEERWPRDVEAYLERGAREWADHPHFWSHHAYAEIPFALWPIRDEDAYEGPFTVDPSAPTPLVIGTTYDPATPYSFAVGMANALGTARVLTMEGDGHTAYGRNSDCVDSATESYLIAGTLPAEGTVCPQEVPFVAPQLAPSEASTSSGRVTVPEGIGTAVLGRP